MVTNVPKTIPMMEIAEFIRLGLLQEVNRLFLHPRGLALEVVIDKDGSARLGGIWDYRSDPEGMAFDDGMLSSSKALTVAVMRASKLQARRKMLGEDDGIQPVPDLEIKD